jgi:nucleolar protein 12
MTRSSSHISLGPLTVSPQAALNIPPPAPLPSTSSLSSTKASRAAAVRDLPPHLQRSLPTAPPKKGSNSALANSVAAASEAAAVLDANADLSELESDADLSDFEVSDEESDDNGGLEEAYEKKQQAGGAQKEVKETVISQETGLPVHESQAGEVLASGKGVVASSSGAGAVESVSKAGKKTKKYTPEGETKEERDGRTIFIGNLPMEIAKSKPMLHALHAHILTSLPSLAKIESTRFRSIAFSKPSADLPATTDEAAAARSKSRAKERVKNWREQQEIDAEGRGGEAEADRGKVFLGEGEKRRVAFIKKDFHPEAGGLNAYIVFAHPAPDRSTKVAPLMDPSLAAQTAVKHCNGTTFEARTIRVDLVRPPASSVTTARATSALWVAGTDPKKSVFVGNLAFGAKEEEVRVFFEDLVKGERGEVPEEGEKEGMEKGRWVQNVRIVRDRETGLGKGFAYVALRVSSFIPFLLLCNVPFRSAVLTISRYFSPPHCPLLGPRIR